VFNVDLRQIFTAEKMEFFCKNKNIYISNFRTGVSVFSVYVLPDETKNKNDLLKLKKPTPPL